MEFVNRICPNCKNPNYMVLLGNFSKAYKYKCMNCNGYFNDNDFEKEPLQPVMNQKVEFIESYIKIGNGDYQWNDNHGELVRCKDCIHYRYYGLTEDTVSECTIDHCENPDEEWFCADGEREEGR